MSENYYEHWYATAKMLPPNGVIVETMVYDHNGARNFADLRREGKYWFVDDSNTYVYYNPTHWRYIY